jgi:hypothetical protein
MWHNKYIGIPFLDKGRDINGIDCWGLVRLVYKQEYNIDLPNFSTDYEADDTERMKDLLAQYKEGWEKIDTPQEGCIVLFSILGIESHMGIAVSSTHFLHARDRYDSAIESFDSVGWKNRITGFYKYSENKSAILNVVPHPLRTERFTIPILPGTTLDQLAVWIKHEYKIAEELASKITILVNGIVVGSSKWSTTRLKDTDRVEYRAVPGKGNTFRLILTLALVASSGGITASIGEYFGAAGAAEGAAAFQAASPWLYAGTQAGVMLVGGALINAIAPIRPPDINNPGSTIQQYMVTGGANQIHPYEAIPVVLGKVRLTPPLGAVNYLTYENDIESYLSMLLLWGYGPLNIDAATLKIGNISISEYTLPIPPVTLDRKTTPTLQQLTDFNAIYGKDVKVVASNITLACSGEYDAVLNESTFGPWIPASSGVPVYDSAGTIVPVNQFTVSLHLPQGLRRIQSEGKDSGKEEAAWVRIEIQVKDGSGPWTTWMDFGLGDGTIKKDAFTVNKTYYNLNSNNEVQVRVRRKTGANPEWTKNANGAGNVKSQIYAQVVLLQTVFLRNTMPIKEPVNCTLAGTALKIKANDQLNGQIEGINAIVQTWAPSWNGTSWVTTTTNNPADLFLYVLKHPANPQRVKEEDVSTKINLTQIQYWHDYCVTKGFAYNSILASQRSILEVLRDICAAGRASPAMVDGKWSVIIDEPKPNIIQHFTPHNSWGFESTKALAKMPDGLRVNYIDEDQDYQQAEIIVYNSGKSESNAELFESMQLPGVTKKSLVIDHARWHFAQAKLRPEIYRLNSDIEYLVCNRGDRVKVMHDVPMWGLGSGRIKNRISSTEFSLDEDVYIDVSKRYTIRVRSSSGASIEKEIDKTGLTSGYKTTIKITAGATSTEINSGDLYMFGEYQQESQDLLVLSIEPSSNKSASLTLMDYGVTSTYNIFTDYATLTASTIFDSKITLPGSKLRDSYIDTDIPNITQIVSDESAAKVLAIGSYEQRIKISYTNPQELPKITDKIECSYYLETSSSTSSGITTSSSLINATTFTEDYNVGSIYISNVVKGQVYKIKLRYVSSDGRTGLWSDEVTHTVGQFKNYLTVDSVSVDLNTHFLIMTPVSNTAINPALFKFYEYRIYKDSGTGDFWNIVPDDTNQIKVVKANSVGQLSLLEFTGSRISESGVKYRIACRTVDIHDNYSDTSALTSILIKTIV